MRGGNPSIHNCCGNAAAEYTYDAWGNPLSITGTLASTIGQLNPFRYRGYVWDSETGLYYVNSRYYNPSWGRWINADSFLFPLEMTGSNLFTYCNNNPVNKYDPTGCESLTLQWSAGMSWLPFVDAVLPFGDAIYVGGIIVCGVIDIVNAVGGPANVPMAVDGIGRTANDIGNLFNNGSSPQIPDHGQDPWNNWGRGSFKNAQESAYRHYEKHGTEVGAKNFNDYCRKASAFKDTVLKKVYRAHEYLELQVMCIDIHSMESILIWRELSQVLKLPIQ